MPLFKLPIATPTPEKPDVPKEKKQDITIRCILFFDGTLNNRQNITERKNYESGQGSKAYLEHRKNSNKELRIAQGAQGIDLKDDSYENDFSNIATLEQNIEKNQNGYNESLTVYTEGAGTEDFEKDKGAGFAFAAGSTGVKAKVTKGIDKAVKLISKGPTGDRKPETIIIKKLTIDIFGFSRGAASARYCVHQLLQDEQTSIRKRLTDAWFDVEIVEVRFVGLFDTVSAYYATQLIKILPLEDWLVKLESVRLAEKVLHLASAEEHRYHFSLHNIKSAKSNGKEYFLPGTHSDVGGGYLDNGSDAGLIVFQGTPRQAIDDRRKYLVTNGWYQDAQLVEEVLSYNNETGDPDRVNLTVSRENPRRNVRNAYCKIPLKIMARAAGDNGINVNPVLEENATGIINDAGLSVFDSKITADFNKAGAQSSPKPWQKADPELNALRHKHLHFSARYNTFFGHNPRRLFFSNKRERYEFDG